MPRKLVLSISLILVFLVPAFAADKPSTIKIMTQNMDAGTDLGYALAGLTGQGDAKKLIDLTLAEVDASGIPARAITLAGQINIAKPDLVALQEVTLWRTGATIATATTVRYDQLELLMAALAELKAPYRVVAVNTLTDIAAPTTALGPGALRFTDRDVLLARSDLSPSLFHVSDVHTDVFKAAVVFGDITVRRGFISALVRVNNTVVRIADTHLDNKYPGEYAEGSIAIQQAQAAELLKFFRNSPQPVIIAGDFNSDAIAGSEGSGPDNTDTAKGIVLAGYTDSWAAAHPTEPGPTWPLFLEDKIPPPPFFTVSAPIERIDLIFSKGLEVSSSAQIGAGLSFPAAASDHVGVLSTFEIPR